jgi:hypothetical protein
MAINSTFYLNGADLATSTAVYLDFQLLNLAPNGFYGDGTIVRQQVSGILLPYQTCSGCPIPCDTGLIDTNTEIALFNINATVGTSTAGPIIIYFYPQENADGIRAKYNGVTYNKLSCDLDGLHQSTNPANFTFAGGIEAGCLDVLPLSVSLPVYNYVSGWVDSGSIVPLTVAPGDVSLTSAPGTSGATWVMVIPKTTSTPTDISVELATVCSDSKCTVDIKCPAELDRVVNGSIVFEDAAIECIEETAVVYYSVRVHDDEDILIGLYDYVFTDAAAENALADGFYLIVNDYSGTPTTEVMQIENGIVIAITPCTL